MDSALNQDLTEQVKAEVADLGVRDALVYRDHVIGLEATIGRLRRDLALAKYHAELEVEDEVNSLRAQLAELRGSATWKAGRLATAPLRAVKKAAR